MADLARIETSDGSVSYQLTEEDVLWTARAASREGPNEVQAIIWTFAQRFVAKAPQSYETTLRSFSQPVNPLWSRTGEKCKPGGPFAAKPDCSREKLDAREWYTNASWAQLETRHANVVSIVRRWSEGHIDNPVPRVTNFAAPRVAKNFLAATPGAELFYAGDNWFIVNPGQRNWPENYVTMHVADRVAGYFPNRANAIMAALWNGATFWWRGA